MELGKQIKRHREAKGYSQDELGMKIYVSRQTISNWECDRTCPDIQSLLLMSLLFDVTVDDLVKGDLEMMQNKVEEETAGVKKLAFWLRLVEGGMLVGALTLLFGMLLLGLPYGILPGIAILILTAILALRAAKYQKQYSVQTYSEIVAFLNGTPRDEEKIARERKHWKLKIALRVLAGAAVGALIAALGIWLSITFGAGQ
jgi:transcriptional regulator with XRE-family HTH domain